VPVKKTTAWIFLVSKEQPEHRSVSPLACDMTAIPLAEREAHLKTSRDLFSHIHEIRELPDGYEFRLDVDPKVLLKAAEFISLESRCCPFMAFALEVKAEDGPVCLRLTGREGVKAFIREEVNGLLGVAVDWKRAVATKCPTNSSLS